MLQPTASLNNVPSKGPPWPNFSKIVRLRAILIILFYLHHANLIVRRTRTYHFNVRTYHFNVRTYHFNVRTYHFNVRYIFSFTSLTQFPLCHRCCRLRPLDLCLVLPLHRWRRSCYRLKPLAQDARLALPLLGASSPRPHPGALIDLMTWILEAAGEPAPPCHPTRLVQ